MNSNVIIRGFNSIWKLITRGYGIVPIVSNKVIICRFLSEPYICIDAESYLSNKLKVKDNSFICVDCDDENYMKSIDVIDEQFLFIDVNDSSNVIMVNSNNYICIDAEHKKNINPEINIDNYICIDSEDENYISILNNSPNFMNIKATLK